MFLDSCIFNMSVLPKIDFYCNQTKVVCRIIVTLFKEVGYHRHFSLAIYYLGDINK